MQVSSNVRNKKITKMYAHQVIDEFKKIKNIINNKSNNYIEAWGLSCEQIKQSMQFYLGDANVIYDIFKNCEGQKLFTAALCDGVKLPYKKCWFDYIKSIRDGELIDERTKSTKRGMLVIEMDENLYNCIPFAFSDYEKIWTMGILGYLISVGLPLGVQRLFNEIYSMAMFYKGYYDPKEIGGFLTDNNIAPFPLIPYEEISTGGEFPHNEKIVSTIIEEDAFDLTVLNMFLMLLSCKNTTLIKNFPPTKLNRVRQKKGKTELFTYHTLKLTPFGNKKQHRGDHGDAETHYRIHLCRGHFKRFTKDKPLFGKYTGLYWWNPSVRGKDKSGVVMKDYALQLNN